MLPLIFILFAGIFNQYSYGNPDDITFPLNNIPPAVKSVVCDGRNSSCPNSETCCQLKSGEYGCCQLAEAVCCGDQLHCCPKGYTCDVKHSRCQKVSKKTSGVVCPGDKITCAEGETCFQLKSGDFGCCPFANAPICDDSHCCPQEYGCNVEEKKCENEILIPWFTTQKGTPLNLPSKLILPSSSLLKTKDGKPVCSDNSTCCELKKNTHGCCPFPQATCCADKMHCCEEGYSCSKSGSKCIRDVSLLPLSTFEEQTCPDEITKCSTSSTCCPNVNDGKTTYTCCPYARGKCCGSNGLCCPHKYQCEKDQSNGNANPTSEPSDFICTYNRTFAPPLVYACPAGQVPCPNAGCCLPNRCKPGIGCF